MAGEAGRLVTRPVVGSFPKWLGLNPSRVPSPFQGSSATLASVSESRSSLTVSSAISIPSIDRASLVGAKSSSTLPVTLVGLY